MNMTLNLMYQLIKIQMFFGYKQIRNELICALAEHLFENLAPVTGPVHRPVHFEG